jgi:hypothetical protein
MNAMEVIVEQLELSGLMIRGESEIVPVDATVRADLVDLMARILVVVFQAKGGRVDDRASLQSQDQAGTSGAQRRSFTYGNRARNRCATTWRVSAFNMR